MTDTSNDGPFDLVPDGDEDAAVDTDQNADTVDSADADIQAAQNGTVGDADTPSPDRV
ncbi:hypothetical protein WDJ51_00910 [Rathayibacter sp. YIM 133350]|uniref:hypothetical protein n=1 Tax=Rathayibacter sp. YIM 133350 TaxID=3131992 RepID=UPI00307F0937